MVSNTSDISYSDYGSTKEINLNEYTLAQERYDERFGLIFFMRSKSSARTLFVKERSTSISQDQIQQIQSRARISNPNLLTIYGIKQIPNIGTFQIYFEDFSTDLQAEIKRHLNEKTRFAEAELYAALYSCVHALACLEQNGISHDFLIPSNIFKFSKEIYKLHDNFTISNKSLLYNHALRGQHLRYVPPEFLESLIHKKERPEPHDPHKVDIFALGMCILDAGLLNTEGDYINKKLMIIDEKALNQATKKFGELYSTAMMQILNDMLSTDPSKRPNPSTLFNRLPGRPVLNPQASSGKKRKVLDQIINSSSPEKFNFSRNESRAMESPTRSTMRPIEQPERASIQLSTVAHNYPTYTAEHTRKLSPIERYAPPPQIYQSSLIGPEADISRVNVSASIKNDPLLSQFVKKLVDPTHEIRASPPKSDIERLSTKLNYQANIGSAHDYRASADLHKHTNYGLSSEQPRLSEPRPYAVPESQYQSQVDTFKHTNYFLQSEQPTRLSEPRPYATPEPLNTQKFTYTPSYTTDFRDQAKVYSDVHHSTTNYGQTYDLLRPRTNEPLSRSLHLQPSLSSSASYRPDLYSSTSITPGHYTTEQLSKQAIKIDSQPRAFSDNARPEMISRDSSSNSTKSKIDELISKALERSTTNLYHSQKVSAEVASSLTPLTVDSTQTKPLSTILERQSSEEFATPVASQKLGSLRPDLRDFQMEGNTDLINRVNNAGAGQDFNR